MNGAELLDEIFRIVNEAVLLIFTGIALYLMHVIRQWVNGKLEVPPHEHQVTLRDQTDQPPKVGR